MALSSIIQILNIEARRPLKIIKVRFVLAIIVGVLVLVFIADIAISFAKLKNIEIVFDVPDKMVASGTNKLTINVQVLENGIPRAGDMVQCWIVVGNGKLLPSYFFLDDEGKAVTVFTPTKMDRYSPKTAQLIFEDISIGKLIEVSKRTTLDVDLLEEE